MTPSRQFHYSVLSLTLAEQPSCAFSFLSRAREVSLVSVVYKAPQVLLVPVVTMVLPAMMVPR